MSSVWTRVEPMGSSPDMRRIIITAIVWNLRLERNRRIFTDIVYSMDRCIYCIINDVLLWIIVFGDLGTIPYVTHSKSNSTENLRLPAGTTEPGDGAEEAARDVWEDEE